MSPKTTTWCRLTPDVVADLPETPAVFEVASLVRSILFIGAAQGNLRARLESLIQEQTKLPPSAGGYYFRYAAASREEESLAERLNAYRAAHAGLVPAGNRQAARQLRAVARDAA